MNQEIFSASSTINFFQQKFQVSGVFEIIAHASNVHSVSVFGERIVTGGKEGKVKVWRFTKDNKCEEEWSYLIEGDCVNMVLFVENYKIICVTQKGKLFIFEGFKQKETRSPRIPTKTNLKVGRVKREGKIDREAFKKAKEEEKKKKEEEEKKKKEEEEKKNSSYQWTMIVEIQYSACLTCFCLSKDQKLLTLGLETGEIIVLSFPSFQRISQFQATFDKRKPAIRTVTFTHNRNYLITGGDDKKIRLFNAKNGVLEKTLQIHTNSVTCIVISQDGKYLISTSTDSLVIFTDLETLEEKACFPCKGRATCLSVSNEKGDDKVFVGDGTSTLYVIKPVAF